MENKNLELWNKVKQPPKEVLKQIGGGRLKGMTDISPMWRYLVLTEVYGPYGIGWKYTVDRKWTEAGPQGIVMAFADVSLYVRYPDKKEWCDAIPGHGGSMLVASEGAGLHASDEGFKMAVTDALSTACKMIGIGADVYMGLWDGSKYRTTPPTGAPEASGTKKALPPAPPASKPAGSAPSTSTVNNELKQRPGMTDAQREKAGLIISKYIDELSKALEKAGITPEKWKLWLETVYGYPNIYAIMIDAYPGILKAVKTTPEVIKNFGSDGAPQDADVPIGEQPLPF